MKRLFKKVCIFLFILDSISFCGIERPFYAEVELLSQPWDTIQEIYADFTYLLAKAGIKGTFDEDSLLVYEIKEDGREECPVEINFMKEQDYKEKENEAGRIILKVNGELDINKAQRRYRIYFDIKENGKKTNTYNKNLKKGNLVPNIGFEEEAKPGIPARTPYFNTAGQKEAYEEGRISLDKIIFHSGSKSVKLIARDEKEGPPLLVTPVMGYKEKGYNYVLRVKPGENYKVSYWIKGENCGSAKYVQQYSGMAEVVLSWFYWYDKEGKNLSRTNVKGIRVHISNFPYTFDWEYGETILKVPNEAVYAYWIISFPCKIGTIWIDDPEIVLFSPVEIVECRKK